MEPTKLVPLPSFVFYTMHFFKVDIEDLDRAFKVRKVFFYDSFQILQQIKVRSF